MKDLIVFYVKLGGSSVENGDRTALSLQKSPFLFVSLLDSLLKWELSTL